MSAMLADAHFTHGRWALIGPTGVTGRMILERALALGHRPHLIGRDPAKLAALAETAGLSWSVVDLDDQAALCAARDGNKLVLNAAGPFAITAPPVITAALATGVDYLDLNGELLALEALFARDSDARAARIALIGGAGFGIAASDGLAMQVSEQLGGADWMRIAVAADSGFGSPAVAESTVSVIAAGGHEVRRGALIRARLARNRWHERDASGQTHAFASAPLADLAAIRRATGAARIVAGVPMPVGQARFLSIIAPILPYLLKFSPVRRAMANAGGHAGPARTDYTSRVWIKAKRGRRVVMARLEAGEGFACTVAIAMAAVAAMLENRPTPGAHSPATAFGPDFIASVPGIKIQIGSA